MTASCLVFAIAIAIAVAVAVAVVVVVVVVVGRKKDQEEEGLSNRCCGKPKSSLGPFVGVTAAVSQLDGVPEFPSGVM